MLQADLDYMIADLPEVVTWKGTDYTCIVSDITEQHDLDIAGITGDYGLQIIISKEDFGTFPAPGERVTVDGSIYRILQASDSPDGISRTLMCGGETQ
jgi:hypothetical protein